MFWFGCSDDEDCDAQIDRRPSERERTKHSTPVSAKRGVATSKWTELFDVLDNSPPVHESLNAVVHHGELGSAHSPIDVDVLESSASSIISEYPVDSADERWSSPTSSTSASGSDDEWRAGADMVQLHQRSPLSSSTSSSSIEDVEAKDGTPLFFGAAARVCGGGNEQRVRTANAAPPRRSHPSFEEWRAEKLDDCSLKEAFFGVGHKCMNLWNGKGCHVNLWGDAETGLQALKAQRASRP